MRMLLITASAFTFLTASQADAQLLSGSGVGQVMGSVTGGATGAIGPLARPTTPTIDSATRGTIRGNARTQGRQSVDRERGAVAVDRSLDTGLETAASQLVSAPGGSANAGGQGSANASGSGSASAQVVGTNTLRGVIDNAASGVSEGASALRGQAATAAGMARQSASGMATQSGAVQGSGQGSGSASLTGLLAASGSSAAMTEGAFAVAPGMPVMAPNGEPIGSVRQIVSDSRGRVQEVLVSAGRRQLTIPAAELSASGNVLVAAEGSATGSAADTSGT